MSPGVLRPVILVEDNPMDADLAMRAFRKCGLANPVEILRDGQEALLTLSVLAKNSPIHDQKADKMGILIF